MELKRQGRARWVALGTVLAVVAVWGGFGIEGAAAAAPNTLTTCTKATTGKTKVVASAAYCATTTSKGVVKAYVKTWNNGDPIANAQYKVCTQQYNALVQYMGFAANGGLIGALDIEPLALGFTQGGDPLNNLGLGEFPACPVAFPGTPVAVSGGSGAPNTLTTCTKATTGKTKVVASAALCKTTNAKGVVTAYAKSWNGDAVAYKVCAQRYDALVSEISSHAPGEFAILDVHPKALDFAQHGDNANDSFMGPFPACPVAFP